jgi:hypothetical protein
MTPGLQKLQIPFCRSREVIGGKVILPIWHKVSKDQVMQYSPSLADTLALNTSTMTLAEVVAQLVDVVSERNATATETSETECG